MLLDGVLRDGVLRDDVLRDCVLVVILLDIIKYITKTNFTIILDFYLFIY